MKKNLLIMSVVATMAFAGCCGSSTDEVATNNEPKTLVLYYSQNGATKQVAEELQRQLGADIEAIEVVNPYDGTFDETVERCLKEMESGVAPEVKPIKADLSAYDRIYLGYPVWCGTYAQPIAGLLKQCDFSGKTLITFCTFGSGGLQKSTEDVANAQPKAMVVEGYGVRTARLASMPAELDRFLIEHGLKEGTVEALPAFMEQHPVNKDEVEVFDQACGDYAFPIGTPVSVAVREWEGTVDYEFTVKCTDREGRDASALVYVTKAEDAKPEFTQVVR